MTVKVPSVVVLSELVVEPRSRPRLADRDTATVPGVDLAKKDAPAALAERTDRMALLQQRLYAEGERALLVVLQGVDTSGKDGTIKNVFRGITPSATEVVGFKVPTTTELAHDYLWRIHAALPTRGRIGIFNRSHYEEVLVVRVHPELLDRQGLPPEARSRHLWDRRFRAINEFERTLVENGVHLVKLFLNLSREEQRRRFLARIETPQKNWKFSSADARERVFWDDYQRVYAEMLSRTSTEWAPWHVIPADHKWFARLAAAGALLHELMRIDPRYPDVAEAELAELRTARAELEGEAG